VVGDSLGIFSGALQSWAEDFITMQGGPEVSAVNPVELAAELEVPSLVVHGDADELISHERGVALYEAFAGPKEFMTIPGGTHDTLLITDAPAYAAMAIWFLSQKTI